MFIGIDLGTSGVKAIVLDESGKILASKTVALTVSRPKPLWSEQNPAHWWQATCEAIDGLSAQQDLSKVKAIGLAGQMHGATLLDKNGEILRPAILWNDGRCQQECEQLEASVPNSRNITGNLMMPGFTAPKLLWVKHNEPELFDRVDKVLLPKDYLRYKLTGDFASDMSDAAGTMWLDVSGRNWSREMLTATGLSLEHMPKLYEGTEVTGTLSPEVAERWGMSDVAVVAGAGDNAAGAVGVGVVKPGQAMVSLGTSGVYFAVCDHFGSAPESALHSFCHAIPNTWHTMSVTLSAASCLAWYADMAGYSSVQTMIDDVEANDLSLQDSQVLFLPYLSGERTPHNDPNAKGVFFGMTPATTRAEIAHAVLEGVGFALADGVDVLHDASGVPDEITLIGGGARSPYWRQMLTDIFGYQVTYREGGEVGPALGAARLAHLGLKPNANLEDICPVPDIVQFHLPHGEKTEDYAKKRKAFKELYLRLKGFSL
ncbi:xylulokinase [Photobacterium rosenbergii]|uniref:Xylulose kinase n=1 Tax=Photobacterium rosenbergii TaxID=294936 RepID=A0A2T3N9S0_9GAMM|nr:xylulokinase [Photobacterium rosenbergii]PSW10280.1 xylulokinase [Photobacterium rosenbergii]